MYKRNELDLLFQNSAITCSPYLVNAITNPLIGKALDFGRKKGYWSQTVARKIAVGISKSNFVVLRSELEVNSIKILNSL